MGKKYLDTKKGTLESSILGVWKTAIEEGDSRMDGRTKGYKSHRAKLETARQRREEKKVNKEEVEHDEASVEEIEEQLLNMSDEEFGNFVEDLDDDLLEGVEMIFDETIDLDEKKPGLLRKIGGAIAKRVPGTQAHSKRVIDKAKKRKAQRDTKAQAVKAKQYLKKKKKAGVFGAEFDPLDEHGDSHVDPKDREELDKAPSDTAKKMKKAQEPAPNQMAETNKNDKSDDGEGLDAVQPKAVKKKFKDRKDKDIDNDGDTDDSDEFLHKKRKAISKAMAKEEVDLDENAEEYAQTAYFKIQSMKDALAKVWGMEEGHNPFAEHKGTKPHKHPHEENEDEMVKSGKTETGKKAAVIDLKPKIKD